MGVTFWGSVSFILHTYCILHHDTRILQKRSNIDQSTAAQTTYPARISYCKSTYSKVCEMSEVPVAVGPERLYPPPPSSRSPPMRGCGHTWAGRGLGEGSAGLVLHGTATSPPVLQQQSSASLPRRPGHKSSTDGPAVPPIGSSPAPPAEPVCRQKR